MKKITHVVDNAMQLFSGIPTGPFTPIPTFGGHDSSLRAFQFGGKILNQGSHGDKSTVLLNCARPAPVVGQV